MMDVEEQYIYISTLISTQKTKKKGHYGLRLFDDTCNMWFYKISKFIYLFNLFCRVVLETRSSDKRKINMRKNSRSNPIKIKYYNDIM